MLEMLLRTDHSVFTRLRKKYTTDGHINYKPMQILLDGGLHDTAVEFCAQDVKALKQDGSAHESADYTNADFAWSQEGTKTTPFADALSDCMLKNSPFTEPTQHNPEVLSCSCAVYLFYLFVSPLLSSRFILCRFCCAINNVVANGGAFRSRSSPKHSSRLHPGYEECDICQRYACRACWCRNKQHHA